MKSYNRDNIKKARELRKNQTPRERKLWYDFLRNYPVKFRRQQPIDNYILDFYCPKAKLGIELDGGGHYSDEKMRYDNNRSRVIENAGIKVIRYCNLDIDNNFYNVCESIDREVKARMNNLFI